MECVPDNAVPKSRTCFGCLYDRYVFLAGPEDPVTIAANADANIPNAGLLRWDGVCHNAKVVSGDSQIHDTPRPFYAWMSTTDDPPISPDSRFFHHQGRYILPGTNTVVAYGWDDLTSGLLHAPIQRDANGEPAGQGLGPTWTNTSDDGTSLAGPDCGRWSDPQPDDTGSIGNNGDTDQWTNAGSAFPCDWIGHVYCFEQAIASEWP